MTHNGELTPNSVQSSTVTNYEDEKLAESWSGLARPGVARRIAARSASGICLRRRGKPNSLISSCAGERRGDMEGGGLGRLGRLTLGTLCDTSDTSHPLSPSATSGSTRHSLNTRPSDVPPTHCSPLNNRPSVNSVKSFHKNVSCFSQNMQSCYFQKRQRASHLRRCGIEGARRGRSAH